MQTKVAFQDISFVLQLGNRLPGSICRQPVIGEHGIKEWPEGSHTDSDFAHVCLQRSHGRSAEEIEKRCCGHHGGPQEVANALTVANTFAVSSIRFENPHS